MARGLGGLIGALFGRGRDRVDWASLLRDACLVCGVSLEGEEAYTRFRVCPACRFHYAITTRERIALLTDPGSFKEKYRTITSLDPLSFRGKVPYRKRLFRDQRRTGLTEAAVVGNATIGGVKVVLLVLDFSFMGGSMGCVVGEKVALAFERAVKRELPLVAVVSSGSARIQEGPLALAQMAKTVMAANRLHQAGLPFLCVMASPTTGHVYASFANLADVLIAEPGALIGLAPLAEVQENASRPLPEGSHTAEAHLAHGMIDLVCDRENLRPLLEQLLRLLTAEKGKLKKRRLREPKGGQEAWRSVQLSRHPQRPTALDYIRRLFTDFVELHGDRTLGDDLSVVWGIGSLEGQTVVVVGQERNRALERVRGNGHTSPEGLRKAQRAMHLAGKFGLPLVTLVDTSGPDPTLEAEERGIGYALATTMSLMAGLPVPTVAVVIGEGGSEAALSLGVADRVLMQENAIYTPITPETAARLMFRDPGRAQEAADALRLTAASCREMGLIDRVVPEPEGGAHTDPARAAEMLRTALVRSLAEVISLSPGKRMKRRYKKFRKLGEYTSYFRAYLAREIDMLQSRWAARSTRPQRGKGRVIHLPAAEPQSAPAGEEKAGQ